MNICRNVSQSVEEKAKLSGGSGGGSVQNYSAVKP